MKKNNKAKPVCPSYLYNKVITYSNNYAIADKLNEYFTEVGPGLEKSSPRPPQKNKFKFQHISRITVPRNFYIWVYQSR